ncbi:pyridoxamine 5'-phosphate oxidase family protein [Actinocrinis puniceicyclus]|uniref:Pyridoxamine 5'-phosphate oxidase family protein n=1 Tax=Actinocrinis puniceicyclus TaxID=977794 RepID=A0A8J7WQL6_9ACTN|nr:pyridoxamine 5'-phosphate oxidase family protein [Actinocrinis puniceicyclus]MBS2964617.1 pyridoxamine 5'-phosphate oxidase family protein [Actinocrinis puniceicyclus]
MRLLETQEVGRLVYTRAGLPAVAPVNYTLRDNEVWVWTGSLWSIAQASRGAVVAFEVDHMDLATQWAWSVCVLGRATLVTDPLSQQRALLDGPAPWVCGATDGLVRITLAKVSGRRVMPHVRHAAGPLPDPRLLYAAVRSPATEDQVPVAAGRAAGLL